MLLFQEETVRRLLPMAEAVPLMRRVFHDLAAGTAQNQPRRRLSTPAGSILHSMAGAWGGYFGTKIYSSNPRHGAHFLFVLYRAEDGVPLALFQANWLGQIRTGATTGFATSLLARDDASTVGLIGAGFQASSQIEAVLRVRSIRRVRVWSRSVAKVEEFAVRCSADLQTSVEPVDSAERAVRGADIVITATSTREPVLDSSWVAPGAHVNAIGSNSPRRRELPADLLRRASLIAVDSLEQARTEAGDLLLGLDDQDWPRIIELKDVRSRPDDPAALTIFKSGGLGVEDVAAAAHVYEKALAAGLPLHQI